MPAITEVVDSYIAMWNERDPDRRRALVARTVSDDARYVDPLMESQGIEGICAMIAGAQEAYPNHHFTLVDGPDAHHDRVRFTWSLAPEGSSNPIALGVDFAIVGADARLREVTGFLAPVGAA